MYARQNPPCHKGTGYRAAKLILDKFLRLEGLRQTRV